MSSHSFFSRSHNPSALTLPTSNKTWMGTTGRVLSTSTTTVKFLGPNRSSTMQHLQQHQQQQLQPSLMRYKLQPSDVRMSERQVIQSEPTRPKPQWSDEEDSVDHKKKVDTDDDDGFEDIFQ